MYKPVQPNYQHSLKILKKVHALRVNETNVTTEKIFHQDLFGIKGNHESNNDEKPCFRCLY